VGGCVVCFCYFIVRALLWFFVLSFCFFFFISFFVFFSFLFDLALLFFGWFLVVEFSLIVIERF